MVVALEVSEDLDHPVNHAGAQSRRDLVPDEAILSEVLLLKRAGVFHNRVTVLSVYVDVLPLNFRSCLP